MHLYHLMIVQTDAAPKKKTAKQLQKEAEEKDKAQKEAEAVSDCLV